MPDDLRPKRLAGHFKRLLRDYETVFGVGERTLKRWVKVGKDAVPIDLPPLDEPGMMAAWWSRHMRNQAPDTLLRLALPAPAPEEPPRGGCVPDSQPGPSVDPSRASVLSDTTLAEGEEVDQARRLVKAAYENLSKAYAAGSGDVDALHRRWEKAQEALRRVKAQDQEFQKARGMLIERPAVQRDLDNAAELLRQMRESMVRRVLELMPGLPAELRESLAAAIIRVREQEERIFRNLASLKTPADVVELLAA